MADKVNWPDYSTPNSDVEIKRFEEIQSIAVMIAEKQHPDMHKNSNVFGQIVNAICGHLINLRRE